MKISRLNEREKLTAVLLVAVLVVLFAIIVTFLFELGVVQTVIVYWVLTTFYSIFAFLVVGTDTIRIRDEVVKEVPVTVKVPVVQPIQIPVENKVIEIVEKPVYVNREFPVYITKEVIKPVVKTVIKTVKQRKRKLNIPKYDYLGSDETRTYHKRSCRLSKLIKKKHKLSSNSKAFFKKRHFKACKVCLKKN